jgi:hypothetical protein
MKPLGKVKIKWSANFAYAIGLIATDGNLSPNRRTVSLTSKDREQIENGMKCLGVKAHIGHTISGHNGNRSDRVQIGDVLFYQFLESIGITRNKSKTIGAVQIPQKYFFDFLRGCFDGDGTFYSYHDPRWPTSYMFYTEFISASRKHIDWLQGTLMKLVGIRGHITGGVRTGVYQLKYAKTESLKLLPKMYYNPRVIALTRKRKKIAKALKVIGKKL